MAVPKAKTKVTNTTSASLYYPYLGHNGRTLAAGATYLVDGDLREQLAYDKRKWRLLAAFDADVTAKRIGVTIQIESDPGAPATTGVTASESFDGGVRRVTLTFTDVAFTLVDEAGVVAYKGNKVYDFPAGAILFMGASADLALTKSSAGVNADWDGDFSLGTVTASNNASLSSTEQNLIPTTATPQAVAGVTTAKGASTSTEACKVFDGTATAIDAYLNFLVDDTDHNVGATPCNLIVNGTIVLCYLPLGDY